MQLTRISIRNLRCIDYLEIYPQAYTSLIGPNNSGKSSMMRGIEIILNQEVPETDEWRRGHEAEEIQIEADFDSLLDWERQKPGVASLVHDNRICIRLRILPPDPAEGRKKPEMVYECKKPQEAIIGWAETWSGLSSEIKAIADAANIDGSAWRKKAKQEELRQAIRNSRPQLITVGPIEWSSEGISIAPALKQALPQAQLIPAIRDATDEGKFGASTSFGMLMKSIILPAVSSSPEYKALLDAVGDLEGKLREGSGQLAAVKQLADRISERLRDLVPAKVTLGIETPDAEKFIGSSTSLSLDDGTSTRIGLQGHGLQRALVFAMLEVLAAQRAVASSEDGQTSNTRRTVLLFEEPELFIHPHLMRRLKSSLTKISRRSDWQVIVTTHSPFLIDIADERRSLVIHRRSNATTAPKVIQLPSDPLAGDGKEAERDRLRAVLDFHPSVCEAFFARNVVLVEGDTELAVLCHQDKLFELAQIDREVVRDTTVVSCDGKWTIVPIGRLLNEFGIPVRAVHDTDRMGASDAELAEDGSHAFHANARIKEAVGRDRVFAVDDTFEDVLSEPGFKFKSGRDKPYRAWKRVRELCERPDFAMSNFPKLAEVLRFAFAAQ